MLNAMNQELVKKKISEIGIVPVIRASSPQHALMAAEAVAAAGIPVAEITMTVPGAFGVIEALNTRFGADMLIGAGTVLNAEAAQRCLDAGARFLVSPGLDVATVKFAVASGTVIMAGALTPTEVIAAWNAGADFVKIFPCSAVGGANYLKALRGPLPHIPLVPTGGVNLNTAADYLRAGAAALGIGGELISSAALEAGNTGAIITLARQYMEIIEETRAGSESLSHAQSSSGRK